MRLDDHNRVILTQIGDNEDSTYINASLIEVFYFIYYL